MLLVWTGMLLAVMRWLEIGPVADWSWWLVLSPFALAFVWFELLEKPLGRDRRRIEASMAEERRRERVDSQFQDLLRPRRRAARRG